MRNLLFYSFSSKNVVPQIWRNSLKGARHFHVYISKALLLGEKSPTGRFNQRSLNISYFWMFYRLLAALSLNMIFIFGSGDNFCIFREVWRHWNVFDARRHLPSKWPRFVHDWWCFRLQLIVIVTCGIVTFNNLNTELFSVFWFFLGQLIRSILFIQTTVTTRFAEY